MAMSACADQCRDECEEERDGHDDHSRFQEFPSAEMHSFTTDRDEPEDGRERTGDGEIRSEIDADENGSCQYGVKGHGLQCGSGDEAERKIVHQICAEADDAADSQR